MNWYFHMATTATSKMSTNWHEQGKNMAYWIIYFMKLYSIPPCLVVNNDQIGIHLVPTTGKWTCEKGHKTHLGVKGGG